jgi:polypeptide N-acetylgalactosaminyltransferase
VINNTPPELLSDIVLVDDFSTKGISNLIIYAFYLNEKSFLFYKAHLKDHLDNYVKRWNGKVVVHHTDKREGLVQARQIGAQMIKGDVIVILDAHCECVANWLPPLLARIKLNR